MIKMKKIILVLLCILLVSCQRSFDIKKDLNDLFLNEKDIELKTRKNNYADYIDYYRPSDIFEIDSDDLSYSFKYNNSSMIMNINIAGIINNHFYNVYYQKDEGFFDHSKLIYERNDTYFTEIEDEPFIYQLYQDNDDYLLYFATRYLIFYGLAKAEDIVPLTSKMLFLAKSSNVKEDLIVANYSSKDIIDYEKKQVNLFETTMPVSGKLDEFLIDNDKEALDVEE